MPWSHSNGWDEIWHDSDFAVPPLPRHLVAGKHGILHALDWFLRRWRSQSVAYGISNSEASEPFCLLQEKKIFFATLCSQRCAWVSLKIQFVCFAVLPSLCRQLWGDDPRCDSWSDYGSPQHTPWSVAAGTSQPMKILGSEGGLYSDTSIFKIKISYLQVHLERKYKRQRVTDSAVTGIALGAYQDWGEQLSRFTMDKETCSIISLRVSVNPATRTEGGHKCSQRESCTQLKVRMAQNKSLTLKWRVD